MFYINKGNEKSIVLIWAHFKLDHALGIDDNDIDKNGYDIVKYICENGINPRKIYIHTDNVVCRDDMYYTLIGQRVEDLLRAAQIYIDIVT